jgi:hypothetical protein
MGLSIPTVIIAVAYILFSLLTTFLDFAINPLCRHPLAQCTGARTAHTLRAVRLLVSPVRGF